MIGTDRYSAFETLRDGLRVEIRAVRPDDRQALAATVDRTSAQSLYRRFFAVRRSFSKQETDLFVNVDFLNHVALVAVVEEGGGPAIIGGARYVLVRPGTAEVAFMVIDEYQGNGLGAALMRHLIAIARAAALKELVAEVLPDNRPMLRLFERCGFRLKRDGAVVHVTRDLGGKN